LKYKTYKTFIWLNTIMIYSKTQKLMFFFIDFQINIENN